MIRRPPRSTLFPTRRSSDLARESRYEGFSFTSSHLGDLAAMQNDATNQLDVVVAHIQHAAAGLANRRESFHQDVVQRGDRKSTTSELQSRQYLVCRLLLEKN